MQVQTLFHEMGHGLTSMLCCNKLQHLFGARGALDIVELPSHILERAARSPEVLHMLLSDDDTAPGDTGTDSSGITSDQHSEQQSDQAADRCKTEDANAVTSEQLRSVPAHGVAASALTQSSTGVGSAPSVAHTQRSQRIIDATLRRERFCAHLKTLDGLIMPQLDAVLHSAGAPRSVRELRVAVHSISEEVLGCEVPPETYARLSLNHLVTYAGMCHAYPYAEAIAELVWSEFLEGDPRNMQAGRALAQQVFAPGGALCASQALQELVPGMLEEHEGGWCPRIE